MFTIVLIFCYLVAFSLALLPEIRYHWKAYRRN